MNPSKQTKAELLAELERLQSEVNILKGQLEASLLLVMNAIERANNEVARHLRTLRLEDAEPTRTDETWV